MSLAEIANLTDMFWIGGTKVGALLGEAIVIPNPDLQQDFAFHIKQRGALLAKGRILGLQFRQLFNEGLFYDLARHSNEMAQSLSKGLAGAGFGFFAKTETNQVFPILPNSVIEKLKADFEFYIWEPHDDAHAVVRLVTSWATPPEQVEAFLERLTE